MSVVSSKLSMHLGFGVRLREQNAKSRRNKDEGALPAFCKKLRWSSPYTLNHGQEGTILVTPSDYSWLSSPATKHFILTGWEIKTSRIRGVLKMLQLLFSTREDNRRTF